MFGRHLSTQHRGWSTLRSMNADRNRCEIYDDAAFWSESEGRREFGFLKVMVGLCKRGLRW